MDHLPSILQPGLPVPRAECLCEVQNLFECNFTDLPSRNGWDFNELSWPVRTDKSKTSSKEIAKFLQSWLFFGLLRNIFSIVEVEISLDDFVTNVDPNDGQDVVKTLTTVKLPALLRRWAEQDADLNRASRKKNQETIIKTLKAAEDVLNGNLFRTNTPEAMRPLDGKQRLAICILYETLRHACATIWPDANILSQLPRVVQCESPRTNMESLGWCPSDIALVHEMLDNTTLLFTSMITRDHGLNHSECSAKECTARQIDNRTYKTQHRQSSCDCPDITVCAEEVGSVIRRGLIPRILVEQEDIDCRLRVTTTAPYVAISHVWSDGLGNVGKNALPLCQLKHLQGIAAASSVQNDNGGDMVAAVWIDTLCVPSEPETRKLAMLQLPSVYEQADRVVVLDAELQNTSLDATIQEKAVRLCISGWMRRIWTLEEGVISRDKLFIKFREGLLPIPGWFSSLSNSIGVNTLRFLNQFLPPRPTFEILDDIESEKQHDHVNNAISSLLMAVQYRTTSWLEDESICFGYLLKMDVAQLFEEKTADARMQKFLTTLSNRGGLLPAHFIFTQEPKLQRDGFRWAPKSFTFIRPGDTPWLLQSLHKSPATLGSSGLRFQYLTFLLEMTPGTMLHETIYFYDVKQILCRVVTLHPQQDTDILKSVDTSAPLALLVTNDVHGAAAFVSVEREEKGSDGATTYYSRYLCSAFTMLVLDMRLEGNKRVFSHGDGGGHPETYSVCTAKFIADKALWHVG